MGKVGMLAVSVVKDVMSEAVLFVRIETTAAVAAEVLTRHRINGAPVLGDHGRVVGVVSKTDLLDPRRAGEGKTVEDVMTRVVFAVRASDPTMQAVRLMVEEDIHRALVVNDDGTLAGIVTPMDVLRGLAKGLSITGDSRAAVEFVDLRTLKSDVRAE
jgi:predicted transcriptional regulator